MLWYETGGTGRRTILLLHGLGATAAVWNGVRHVLEQRELGRWIAPDLSGHGASDAQAMYSVGQLSSELALLVQGCEELFVIGHSLGAYLALALGSGWFNVDVQGIVGVGPKISWSAQELQGTRELAGRPVRWYASADEAWNRYRRVSGLEAGIAADDAWLQRGVRQEEQGWRLAQDPRTFSVAGAPFATLATSARSRIVLARGSGDTMVSTAELQQHAPRTAQIEGAGHNTHVEKPEAIVGLLETVLQS